MINKTSFTIYELCFKVLLFPDDHKAKELESENEVLIFISVSVLHIFRVEN